MSKKQQLLAHIAKGRRDQNRHAPQWWQSSQPPGYIRQTAAAAAAEVSSGAVASSADAEEAILLHLAAGTVVGNEAGIRKCLAGIGSDNAYRATSNFVWACGRLARHPACAQHAAAVLQKKAPTLEGRIHVLHAPHLPWLAYGLAQARVMNSALTDELLWVASRRVNDITVRQMTVVMDAAVSLEQRRGGKKSKNLPHDGKTGGGVGQRLMGGGKQLTTAASTETTTPASGSSDPTPTVAGVPSPGTGHRRYAQAVHLRLLAAPDAAARLSLRGVTTLMWGFVRYLAEVDPVVVNALARRVVTIHSKPQTDFSSVDELDAMPGVDASRMLFAFAEAGYGHPDVYRKVCGIVLHGGTPTAFLSRLDIAMVLAAVAKAMPEGARGRAPQTITRARRSPSAPWDPDTSGDADAPRAHDGGDNDDGAAARGEKTGGRSEVAAPRRTVPAASESSNGVSHALDTPPAKGASSNAPPAAWRFARETFRFMCTAFAKKIALEAASSGKGRSQTRRPHDDGGGLPQLASNMVVLLDACLLARYEGVSLGVAINAFSKHPRDASFFQPKVFTSLLWAVSRLGRVSTAVGVCGPEIHTVLRSPLASPGDVQRVLRAAALLHTAGAHFLDAAVARAETMPPIQQHELTLAALDAARACGVPTPPPVARVIVGGRIAAVTSPGNAARLARALCSARDARLPVVEGFLERMLRVFKRLSISDPEVIELLDALDVVRAMPGSRGSGNRGDRLRSQAAVAGGAADRKLRRSQSLPARHVVEALQEKFTQDVLAGWYDRREVAVCGEVWLRLQTPCNDATSILARDLIQTLREMLAPQRRVPPASAATRGDPYGGSIIVYRGGSGDSDHTGPCEPVIAVGGAHRPISWLVRTVRTFGTWAPNWAHEELVALAAALADALPATEKLALLCALLSGARRAPRNALLGALYRAIDVGGAPMTPAQFGEVYPRLVRWRREPVVGLLLDLMKVRMTGGAGPDGQARAATASASSKFPPADQDVINHALASGVGIKPLRVWTVHTLPPPGGSHATGGTARRRGAVVGGAHTHATVTPSDADDAQRARVAILNDLPLADCMGVLAGVYTPVARAAVHGGERRAHQRQHDTSTTGTEDAEDAAPDTTARGFPSSMEAAAGGGGVRGVAASGTAEGGGGAGGGASVRMDMAGGPRKGGHDGGVDVDVAVQKGRPVAHHGAPDGRSGVADNRGASAPRGRGPDAFGDALFDGDVLLDDEQECAFLAEAPVGW